MCGAVGQRLRLRRCAGAGSASSSASSVLERRPGRRRPAATGAGRRRSARSCWACGSHFTQSHSGRRSGAATTATRRSSGAWKVASWHDHRPGQAGTGVAVAAQHDPAERPQRHRDRQVRHAASGRGRSGAARARSSAPGPRPAWSPAATIATASCCGPTAIRTSPKSSSVLRRSHSRPRAAIDHSASGSGCRQVSAARCWAGGPPGPLAHLGQVAHVVAPLGVELGLLVAAADAHRADAMPSIETPKSAAGDPGHRVPPPRPAYRNAIAPTPQTSAASSAAGPKPARQLLGQLRRRLQQQLPARQRRRRLARRPAEHNRAHDCLLPGSDPAEVRRATRRRVHRTCSPS